jgi:hypothetical protein
MEKFDDRSHDRGGETCPFHDYLFLLKMSIKCLLVHNKGNRNVQIPFKSIADYNDEIERGLVAKESPEAILHGWASLKS